MPESTENPLLQQLRDVHLPAEVSWWPPAPGWWLLFFAAMALLVWLLHKWLAWHRSNQYRRVACVELNKLYSDWQINEDTKYYLQSASAVLRRTMLHLDGGRKLSSLTGQQWMAALNSFSKTGLPAESVLALTVACYQQEPEVDIELLHRQLSAWLKAHKRTPYSTVTVKPDNRVPADKQQEASHA